MNLACRLLSVILAFFVSTSVIFATEQSKVDKAINTIRILCLVGDSLDIKVKGDASLSFLKKGVNGEIIFSKKNINGVVDGLEGKYLIEELENIRGCIEPRIDRVLDLIINSQLSIDNKASTLLKIPTPQLWEGNYIENSKSEPMRLHLEKIDGKSFFGKINWPSTNNVISNFEGVFVTQFINFSENSKWRLIKSSVKEQSGLIWVKFSEKSVLEGSGIELNGTYYGYITKSGVLKGKYFSPKKSNPRGDFTLFLM